MKIAYTCFEISSRCNMNCEFCFSDWRNNREQISTEKAKHVIDVLIDNGLKAINLTGGDPLVRDDIIEIIKYCKDKGLMTIISTNGILLPQKEDVLNYIDAINLPLDSFDPMIHNKMRPCALENHHEHVLKLVDYISSKYPKVKIKINTMVGKENINDIPNMFTLMDSKILSWKLGKFFASGYGKDYRKRFEVDKDVYELLMKKVKENYKNSIIVEEDFEIENDYDVFVDGNGNLCEVTENGVMDRGSIDNLSKLKTKSGNDDGLWGEYLKEVYNYEVKENES